MKLETIGQKDALQVLATGGRVYALSPINEDSSIKDLLGVEHFAIIDDEKKAEPKAKKKDSKPATERKPKCDIGKMIALYNAGWSIAKIADELRVSEPTIRTYLKKYTKPVDKEE